MRTLGLLLLASLTIPVAASHVVEYPLHGDPTDVVLTAGDTVWVGTSSGVYRLDRNSGTFTRVYTYYVRTLVLGADGALWLQDLTALYSTILRIDPDGSTVTPVRQFPNENVYSLSAGVDGALWIVLVDRQFENYRLVRLDSAGAILSSVPVPKEWYSGLSQTQAMTSHGLWWIETVHGGLRLLEPSGALRSFPLPFNEAWWLLATDQFLWVVGTNGQVAKIGFDGSVLAQYQPATRLFGATVDAAGDLWLRERNRLSKLTRDGVYTPQFDVPPSRCPDLQGFSILRLTSAGEIVLTNDFVPPPPIGGFPRPCVDDLRLGPSLMIIDPAHAGDPHDIPTAGTVALLAIAMLLAVVGVAVIR